ncbi:MAG TPA: hypothetical protein VF930_10960 [Stellaceae bacterium]
MMARKEIDRRVFLRASLAAGTGLAALMTGTRSGAALTLQEVAPSSPLGLELQNRCGTAAEHAALLAELQAKLADGTAAGGTTLSESAQCPICGCTVTAYRAVK